MRASPYIACGAALCDSRPSQATGRMNGTDPIPCQSGWESDIGIKTYQLLAPLLDPLEVNEPTALDLAVGEVLVTVWAGGICGSNLPHFAGSRSTVLAHDDRPGAASVPRYPMHEVVGEVIASSSSDVARGDIAVGGRAPWPGWGETSASMPPVWRRTPSGVRRRRCCSSRSRVRSTLRTRSGRSPGSESPTLARGQSAFSSRTWRGRGGVVGDRDRQGLAC